ncbi:uncharacterized protein LOC123426200 [Hordeum vulgare subsp. vulgare]|uniref:uncharacterized protein LOC123426200 n=1 Tax=Hordeum vulgare subsp. vulgare TaxID=112509 RepID=UPI001D1A5ADC|nr:uncharacterized protein LOC123426200 [Hordeum vulgare subsp. vulgare]XP_044965927.1 uncharacterized protein LOC123426200 [Hordeum vulgare subsp. vulgare]
MSSVFEVLEDTTAAAGAGGAAAAAEAEVAGESLKNGVYTGAAYRDHEKLCRLVELEGRSVTEPSTIASLPPSTSSRKEISVCAICHGRRSRFLSQLSWTAISLVVGIDLVVSTFVESVVVLLLYLCSSPLLCPD